MSDLVRFGVAMDRALLSEFDRRNAARGYENRSEALRDLVRADLTRAAWDRGADVAATITQVYDDGVQGQLGRACARVGEEASPPLVSAALRVPLAAGRSLEILAVRGAAAALTALAGRLSGVKGVLACELTLASPAPPLSHPISHAPVPHEEHP
jgi:CopG family nickel-responsive transcriptional regulator